MTKPPNRGKPVKHENVIHQIETSGSRCHARIRLLSLEKLPIVLKEIDFILDAGYSTRSNSEYSSPIYLVSKKDTGKFRLVGDYRSLEQQILPNRYPTPSVQKLYCIA